MRHEAEGLAGRGAAWEEGEGGPGGRARGGPGGGGYAGVRGAGWTHPSLRTSPTLDASCVRQDVSLCMETADVCGRWKLRELVVRDLDVLTKLVSSTENSVICACARAAQENSGRHHFALCGAQALNHTSTKFCKSTTC